MPPEALLTDGSESVAMLAFLAEPHSAQGCVPEHTLGWHHLGELSMCWFKGYFCLPLQYPACAWSPYPSVWLYYLRGSAARLLLRTCEGCLVVFQAAGVFIHDDLHLCFCSLTTSLCTLSHVFPPCPEAA